MVSLVDTNVLVYHFDARSPDKQRIARDLLRTGVAERRLVIAHQAVIEFYRAVTKHAPPLPYLLDEIAARREAEVLMRELDVLYPNADVLHTALRGRAEHQLSWYDAHMWAYAEVFGLTTILSEDFQHDRMYGRVRAVNPFR